MAVRLYGAGALFIRQRVPPPAVLLTSVNSLTLMWCDIPVKTLVRAALLELARRERPREQTRGAVRRARGRFGGLGGTMAPRRRRGKLRTGEVKGPAGGF